MNEENPTRQEIQAILSNPASTEAQRIQAKIILGKRLANAPERIHQIFDKLPPEIAERLRAKQPVPTTLKMAAKAKQEQQRLEELLAQLQSSDFDADTHTTPQGRITPQAIYVPLR